MDQDPAVIKLPIFSKTSKLAAIPGQPEGVTYAVVWDACRDPEDGFGYVAELLPGRRPAAIPRMASATWPNCCPAVARACWRGLAPAARSIRAIDR